MRLPAIWLVTAFAMGIAVAQLRQVPLSTCAPAAAAALSLSALVLWKRRTAVAWAVALLAWTALGAAAVAVERAGVPSNRVTNLIAAGRLDTGEPLRWRGRLRTDPEQRPWGWQYEIDLEQVQTAGAVLPARGGLRATLYNERNRGPATPSLRAGDRVEALLKAAPPHNFRDPGAFDEQAYLATQGIDLTGGLRSASLITLVDQPTPGMRAYLARAHGALLKRVDELFAGQPENTAVLKAMLLGDRSFVDNATSTAFQKTAAYHVLVVAGLHTGALVAFLFWLCRRSRAGMFLTVVITLSGLAAYVAVVEDRPPVFRAACMAGIYLLAKPLFRRVELLNTLSVAALGLLIWKPSFLADSSFQLSFLAAAVIAGLALPWIERTSAPYLAGLAHLGDATRDIAHPPRVAQFRIEARAAIAWLSSRLSRRWPMPANALIKWPARGALWIWDLVLLSLAIQVGMLPLLAQDFHRVSLAGPLSNIPAVLLTGVIIPFGFLALTLSFVSIRLAAIFAHLVSLFTAALLHVIEWFARFPRLSYRIPGPPVWLTLAFLFALAALAIMARRAILFRRMRPNRRRLPPPIALAEWTAGAAVIALGALIACYPFAPRLAHAKTEVTVLDVGQGDSIFAAFPNGRTMLVDGGGLTGSEWVNGMQSGPDVGEQVVSPYLWSRGLKSLDVVAVTHGHHDHIGGLVSVLQNFSVGELWIGRDEDSPEFDRLLDEAKDRGIRIVHKTQGDLISWDAVHGKVLWPPQEQPARGASNDDSLVMRIEDGAASFLLTGDIEQREERAIVASTGSGGSLSADFLKVPHHGSKTSSTPAFLAAAQPRVAVISVGAANEYGHPSQEVVERYNSDGAQLLRTDRDGAVTALSDGQKMVVSGFASAPGSSLLSMRPRTSAENAGLRSRFQ